MSRMGIGVGTPGRVLTLIREGMQCLIRMTIRVLNEIGALKLDEVTAVVLDMSAMNEKQQGIFDIRETQKDVLDLLNYSAIKSRLGDQIKLLVF